MNVTTAKRHHWGTVLFGFLLGTPVLAVLLRPTIGQVLCFNVASLWVYICHANLNLHLGPLNYVLNSPNNHRIHHSREAEHYNRNFANIFSFWDVITGAYLDPSHALPSTGLRTRPRHIGEALVWPLLQASKG